ncbi:MAG: hypothetical protein ABR607_17375, partial [Pyrinomonadaceae bacterium]
EAGVGGDGLLVGEDGFGPAPAANVDVRRHVHQVAESGAQVAQPAGGERLLERNRVAPERVGRHREQLRTARYDRLVADRRGQATAFAIAALQERGSLFVGPRTELYEGMVVGENSRDNDLDVNASKEKKLTNMRASGSDEAMRLVPDLVLCDYDLPDIKGDEVCRRIGAHETTARVPI